MGRGRRQLITLKLLTAVTRTARFTEGTLIGTFKFGDFPRSSAGS